MTQPLAIGTILEVQARDAAPSQFIVAGYDDRAYMQLTKKNDVTVGMCLHPAHALRIATNGGDSGVKVLDGISLADIVVKATEVIVGVPTPSTTVTKTGGESKKMRALRIIAAHPNATRKELIQMFVEQLEMTPAGASTYASMK